MAVRSYQGRRGLQTRTPQKAILDAYYAIGLFHSLSSLPVIELVADAILDGKFGIGIHRRDRPEIWLAFLR